MTISTQLYANNARSTIAIGLNPGDLSITVATGDGAKFPSPSAGQYFLVTIEVGASNEIIKITSRTGDVLTVDAAGRGLEGTTDSTWPLGSLIECRITKATLTNFARFTDKFADIASVDTLSAPSASNSNSYLTQSFDDVGSPIMAVSNIGSDTWTFPTYTIIALTGTVGGATSTTGFTAAAAPFTGISSFSTGRFIIEFTNGALTGQCRMLTGFNTTTGAITWTTATASAPLVGIGFNIYQSDASAINQNITTYLPKSGGTMTGDIVLVGAATTNLNPVTKLQWDTQNALLAPLANPTFTGTPTLPTGTVAVTQAPGNSTTAIATTAFVTTADNLKANLASPTFTGTPTFPTGAIAVTQVPGTNNTSIATTAFVAAGLALKADLASPTFTGTPTMPSGTVGTTQSPGTNNTTLATTAFVTTADNLKANLASPSFSGTPSLPTGTTGVTQSTYNNTTALATTAFVFNSFTASGLRTMYQSSQTAFSTWAGTGTAYSFAHGLGAIPVLVQAVMVNTSSDLGYTPGMEVPIPLLADTYGGGGINVRWDSTNVYVYPSNNGTTMTLCPASGTGNRANISNACWNLRFNVFGG